MQVHKDLTFSVLAVKWKLCKKKEQCSHWDLLFFVIFQIFCRLR